MLTKFKKVKKILLSSVLYGFGLLNIVLLGEPIWIIEILRVILDRKY